MRKGYCRTRSLEVQQRLQYSGGQDKEKGADSKWTGLTGSNSSPIGPTDLTGASSKSGNSSGTKDEKRPSFKELLAKYEKKGAAQKQKEPSSKVKDTKPSSERQE